MKTRQWKAAASVFVAGAVLLLAACSGGPAADQVATEEYGETLSPVADEQLTPQEKAAQLEAKEREIAEREMELRTAELAKKEQELARREAALTKNTTKPAAPSSNTPTTSSSAFETRATPAAITTAAPEAITVTVPAATEMDVEFNSRLSSETSQVGDPFVARVTRDLFAEGALAIPAGSEVLGEVSEVVPSKKIGGTAQLALHFKQLRLPSGDITNVNATFAEAGKSQGGKDAATIGGAAAGGALLGRLLKKSDKSKGTLIGAVLGAAVGTAIAAKNPGDPVEIEAGAVVALRLDDPVEIVLENGQPSSFVQYAKVE
ncbi:MAG: glycine zipper 2TM domain-containing protein [Acidobacteriota bacterium]|nr:MAG: glycine zipper 2TM domain-containing protein [Acidobacteriota bacterium]